jgi:hypothetical protein
MSAVLVAATEARKYQAATARARKHIRAFEASGDEYGIGTSYENPHWKAFRSAYECVLKWARYLSQEHTEPQLKALWQLAVDADARRTDRIHHEREAELDRLNVKIIEAARNRSYVVGH